MFAFIFVCYFCYACFFLSHFFRHGILRFSHSLCGTYHETICWQVFFCCLLFLVCSQSARIERIASMKMKSLVVSIKIYCAYCNNSQNFKAKIDKFHCIESLTICAYTCLTQSRTKVLSTVLQVV